MREPLDDVDWPRTALLLIDLQNDFLHPEGAYARGGVTARPEGLYLIGVEYPERHELPALCPWQGLW